MTSLRIDPWVAVGWIERMKSRSPRFRVIDKGSVPWQSELRVARDVRDQRFEPPASTLVEFRSVNIQNVDFSRTTFAVFLASSSLFNNCDFTKTRFSAGFLAQDGTTIFRNCRFDRSDLHRVHPLFARFEGCSFDHANLREFRSFYAEFIGCSFDGPIVKAKFWGRPAGASDERPKGLKRSINEFHGNDFTHAEIYETRFAHGIDIDAQRWPQGGNYIKLNHVHDRFKRVRAHVNKWPNGKEKAEALIMLDVYEADCDHQEGLFARRDEIPLEPATRNRVWQMLESAKG
jgi:hypothetical protein